MIATLALIFVVVATAVSWMILLRDSSSTNVPGPFPYPILGNALKFIGTPPQFLELLYNLHKQYGDATRVYLLHKRYMILYHPRYIEPLVSNAELITKGRSYNYLRAWLGDGLLTSSGNKWRTHRKFLTPAFHFNILQLFLPIFLKNEKILVQKLKSIADQRAFDLFPVIALTALDNVTESIMGVSVNAQKDSESSYVKAIGTLSRIVAMRMRNPFVGEEPVFNFLSQKKMQDDAIKILHEQTKSVIEMRRKELAKDNITKLDTNTEIGIKNKHAFLDLLLLAEVNGKKLEDEDVREEVDTFMFEGHDTTASGITFTLYNIAKYQDVQEKILREQRDILGDDLHRDPTYAELQQMKYLECVIKESHRLFPPVPLIERWVPKDADIGGLIVPKNTSIIINIMYMQRHPDLYDDPLEFRPERFLGNTQRNPFAFLAFSAGPRNCVGQKFAMLEMKVTIAGVVKNFKLLHVNKEDPILCADLILRSENGVDISIKPRY